MEKIIMNSLEFINKLIEDYKDSKERFLDNLKRYPNEEVFTKCVKSCEQRLQTLQQIKTELEAWEVVKRKGFIFTKEEKNQLIGNTWNIYRLSSRELNNKEYEIIKKALEVKDEDRKQNYTQNKIL